MSSNIAVIVLDTLRYDYFDTYFDWLPGTQFENAYSTSHWTVPAHGSLFTGLYPSEIGVHSKSQTLDCNKSTIAEELLNEGYSTTKYSANLNIHEWNGWNRGFEVSIGPDELLAYYGVDTVDFTRILSEHPEGGSRMYLSAIKECIQSDCSTTYSLLEGIKKYRQSEGRGGAKSTLKRLKRSDFDNKNEFLFVNLMDVHSPYFPPKEYREIDSPVDTYNWEPFVSGISNLREVKTAYEDSVRYLSDIYKDIFGKLKQSFDYIITLSDHGEMLGEFGMIDHSYGVYEELTHIPISIWGEGFEPTQTRKAVSLLDVHATIGNLAGIDVDSRGRPLSELNEDKKWLAEYQGFPPWLRTRFLKEGMSESRYNELDKPLWGYVDENGNYSFETHGEGLITESNLGTVHDSRVNELHKLKSSLDVRKVNAEGSEVDDTVLDRLKDLGYA